MLKVNEIYEVKFGYAIAYQVNSSVEIRKISDTILLLGFEEYTDTYSLRCLSLISNELFTYEFYKIGDKITLLSE